MRFPTVSLSVAQDDFPTSVWGDFELGAVASDARPCATVGTDILGMDGTAVDAAIASLLCGGVFNAHSMGVGGGFFMTVYIRETGQAYHLNAREAAPSWASANMYDDDWSQSVRGPKAIAVPGEIVGYYEAKARFGNPDLSMLDLMQPTIDMCRQGVEVGFAMGYVLNVTSDAIKADPGFSSVFINPDTGEVWQIGDYYKCLALADTFERLGWAGVEDVRFGVTATNMVRDIQEAGGLITSEDILYYNPRWEEPISVNLDDYTLYSNQPPGSGAVLAYMLNILDLYNMTSADLNQDVTYQRIAETFKWGYARRSQLGDPFDPSITASIAALMAEMTSEATARDVYNQILDDATFDDPSHYGADFYLREEGGTAHLSVLAPNGDAVAVTSTINTSFGSKFMSPSTGIIMNNEMDDFSFPGRPNIYGLEPSPSNFPIPGKRPQSSMAPAILVDPQGDVRLIAGASGGSRITSSIAWTNLDYLSSVGHDLTDNYGLAVVQAIARSDTGVIRAAADGRKDGGVGGVNTGSGSSQEDVSGASNNSFGKVGLGLTIFVVGLNTFKNVI